MLRTVWIVGFAIPLAVSISLAWSAVAHADTGLAVLVVTAERKEATRQLTLTGEIAARDTVSAAFPIGGRILEILVDAGDRVSKGSALARIEQVQQEQARRSAKAKLAAAEAEFSAARDASDRQTGLLERGATTRAARDAAADRFAAAVAGKAQAEAELEQAQDTLEDTVLFASADAIVISRQAEPGQVVGAAQPIVKLALGEGFDAVFDVPESQLVLADPRSERTISLSPLDRSRPSVTGRVREISPLVEPTTGTVEVKVAMEAPLPGLTYGDAVRGTTLQDDGEGISLPWSSVSATKDGPAVWVVAPDTSVVSLRRIEVKRYTSDAVIVASGIEQGDMVVIQGAQLLYPGRLVQPVEESN